MVEKKEKLVFNKGAVIHEPGSTKKYKTKTSCVFYTKKFLVLKKELNEKLEKF